MNSLLADLNLQIADCLGKASSSDYIDWASQCLSQGDDSPALLSLACAYAYQRKWEILPLYHQARLELGLPQRSEQQLLLAGARLQAAAYLSHESSAIATLERLYALWQASDYHLPYLGWISGMDEAASSPEFGSYFYPGLQTQSWEQLLLQECQAFLNLSGSQGPEPGYQSRVCQHCGAIQPESKIQEAPWFHNLFLLKRAGEAAVSQACTECGSTQWLAYDSMAGRQALAAAQNDSASNE